MVGYKEPENVVVVSGKPETQELICKTITGCTPGILATRDTDDDHFKACSAMEKPLGFLDISYKKGVGDTYEADQAANIQKGTFIAKSFLTKGCKVTKGDLLMNWTSGQLVGPVAFMQGGLALGIPFGIGDSTNPNDTSIDLPANMLVHDIIIEVETLSSGETLDVGFDNAAESGDLDGLVDGISLTNALKVYPDASITGTTDMYYDSCTRGILLADYDAGAGTGDQGIYHPKPYRCDGTIKSVNYVKATHNVGTGIIWLVLESEGLEIAGKAENTVDASAGVQSIMVECKL